MFGSRQPATTLLFLLAATLVVCLASARAARAETPIDFGRDIRPILADNCFACHGPDENKREGGLRLDQKQGAVAEADSGSQAIVPGDVDSSELYARLVTDDGDLRMPPADSNKIVTPEQIELIRRWIEQGAAWQDHWAFTPPRQDRIPNVKDKSWLKNPIDLFVLSRLEAVGLAPSSRADKRTLLRRVTFDLTGLPPSAAEVNEFLVDDSPKSFERVVDRLLESERYGEHMARFWLDAARYGDTHGLHLDNYREMWPYRDWVIKAFNSNMPFDQFVTKQLAGDLLPQPTKDDLVATGFIRCHVTTNEGGSIDEEVYVRNVVDRVTTTGTVFLGLSMECTRCHDHKYDPLTMVDFYSMFAFFNSLDGKAMDGNTARHAPIVKLPSEDQEQQTRRLTQEIDAIKTKIREEVAAVQMSEIEGGSNKDAGDRASAEQKSLKKTDDGDGDQPNDFAAWIQAKLADDQSGLPVRIKQDIKTDDAERTADQRKRLRDYFVEHVCSATQSTFEPLHEKLESAQKNLDDLDKQIASTLVFKELSKPRPAYVLHRGEYDQRGAEVSRATPAVLPPLAEDVPRNRLGLARWLVDRRHPLTARVAVNRFWQQVFGTGIVKTSEDFGSQGEPPSHPELFDWLAVQFVDDGWDVKAMMKRIVMSATYQQSSKTRSTLAERDPANRLLARGPRVRLDAEMLRDQALAVSGQLVNKLGGPSVKPPQPDGLWHAVGYSGSNTVRFKADEGADKIHRRTVYTFIKRTAPPPQMSTFDGPSRELCTVRRERTNTPLQALLLMNDPQYFDAARALAKRAVVASLTVQGRIDELFQLCLARHPKELESAELASAVEDLMSAYREDSAAAELLANADPRVDGDGESQITASETAVWTVIANVMLNLDEVITKN